MFTMSYPYRSEQHELLNHGELGRWLSAHFPLQNLVLYRHRREQTFVIAQRTTDSQMVDVMNLGRTLSAFDRDGAHKLEFLFSTRNTPEYLSSQIRREHDQCQSYHTTQEGYARGMVERAHHRPTTSIVV